MQYGKIKSEFLRGDLQRLSNEGMIGMGLRVLSDIPEFKNTGRKLGDAPMIRVEKICFRCGRRSLFFDFSAEFYRGQITAVTGVNGV